MVSKSSSGENNRWGKSVNFMHEAGCICKECLPGSTNTVWERVNLEDRVVKFALKGKLLD